MITKEEQNVYRKKKEKKLFFDWRKAFVMRKERRRRNLRWILRIKAELGREREEGGRSSRIMMGKTMKRGSKESRRDQKPSNFREIRDIFCFGMRIYEQLNRFTLIQQKSVKKYRPITKIKCIVFFRLRWEGRGRGRESPRITTGKTIKRGRKESRRPEKPSNLRKMQSFFVLGQDYKRR